MTEPRPERGHPSSHGWRRPAQYLALPLGDLAPAHQELNRWVRAWRRHSSSVLTAAGCVLAAAGLLITWMPRPIQAFATPSRLQIAGVTLQREAGQPVPGYTLYGGDASVLLSGLAPSARAAGAATLGGRRTTGSCAPAAASRSGPAERCRFRVGTAEVTSLDVFDRTARTWTRRYSDGVVITISAPAGQAAIPVPLPLGR
ncbi:MAG TPA: hypothetical protein VF155_08110 [Candidatus Dormibacteraeota bacterium]